MLLVGGNLVVYKSLTCINYDNDNDFEMCFQYIYIYIYIKCLRITLMWFLYKTHVLCILFSNCYISITHNKKIITTTSNYWDKK